MIKAIAFDYGGVIELSEKGFIEKVAKCLKTTKEEWSKVYFTMNHLSNTGKKTRLEVFELVAKEFGASDEQILQIHKILQEDKEKKRINLGLIDIIKDLKKKGYQIGLISNYSTKLRQRLTDQNIIDLFDVVIVSGEVGYQKPQPEIFEILINKLGIGKNEMIFIDDQKQSILGAENIGYIPILYKNDKQLLEDLSKLGV